jgi:putative ABC transport system permease protein
MDNLFGIPLSSILIALTMLVALIFGFLVWIWVRNPLLVRMGLRNVVRRKTQTVLIVAGMMLATLIMSAAFATGDTVGYSITNQIYREMAGVDIVIAFDRSEAPEGVTEMTDADVAGLTDVLADDPNVDGVSGLVQTRVPAINTRDQRAEPRAVFAGIDPATIGPFGGLSGLDGNQLDPAALGEDRAFVSESLSENIGVEDGDRFTIHYEGQPHEFVVMGVIVDNAISSQMDPEASGGTAGGLVTTLERWREITGEAERIDLIAVSVTGGVRDSLPNIAPVEDRIDAYIEESGAPLDQIFTKTEFVDLAELVGSLFVTLFVVFGLFSIAAGIMLIFLTFVMLAAERRPEMGMARAVGMKRMHLTESFVAEGMTYNIGAAMIGALLGLAVAGLIVWILSQVFSDFGVGITFHFNAQGFVIAYFLGLVITFATVAFSSWRAANLNIVEAVRDLPDPEQLRATDRSLGRLGLAVIAVVWSLAWIALVAVWCVAGFIFFTLGLGTYGAGFLAGGLIAGAYVWGVMRINRPWRSMSWRGRIGYVLWWVAFNVMAGVTWLLFRTRAWARRYSNAGGWATWMLIIGAMLVWWGYYGSTQAFAVTGGVTLILFAAAMLAVYFGVSPKPAFTVASFLALWYWLLPLPFSLLIDDASDFQDPVLQVLILLGIEPEEEITGDIEMFFVSGIAMTAAATLLVIFNADQLQKVANAAGRFLGGVAPALRTAISYPLAARFRTGMTLAMFTLVVFSLVVMATINSNFTQLFLGDDARGGFDVRVSASESNRIPDLREALRQTGYDVDANIEGAGTLVMADPDMRVAGSTEEFEAYALQGMDDEFLSLTGFTLTTRAAGYDSDAEVFEAIRNDPTLAIVDESRSAPEDPFADPDESDFRLGVETSDLREQPWEPIPITVRNRETRREVELRVIGVLEPQVTSVTPAWLAVFAQRSVVDQYFDGGETESFYLTTREDSKSATIEVASQIEAALLDRGVVAASFEQEIDDAAAQSNAFQYLFEGFMGLGLVVGIAALGVIAFRTVAERRQQIGMMRAIGYTRRMIAMSFFFESSFIALAGILMGLALGAALSYNILTEFIAEQDGIELDFHFPWPRLLGIVAIAYLASALMTLIPARSASKVPVAEALRYE